MQGVDEPPAAHAIHEEINRLRAKQVRTANLHDFEAVLRTSGANDLSDEWRRCEDKIDLLRQQLAGAARSAPANHHVL